MDTTATVILLALPVFAALMVVLEDRRVSEERKAEA